MTRYLLAAATVAGALSFATPATACELQYCTWARPVCELGLVNCGNPVPTDECIYTQDVIICI